MGLLKEGKVWEEDAIWKERTHSLALCWWFLNLFWECWLWKVLWDKVKILESIDTSFEEGTTKGWKMFYEGWIGGVDKKGVKGSTLGRLISRIFSIMNL